MVTTNRGKRQADLHRELEKLSRLAPERRVPESFGRFKDAVSDFIANGPRRVGREYWEWVVAEHEAGRRRVPARTLEIAREQIGPRGAREPGEDEEELDLSLRAPLPETKTGERHGSRGRGSRR